jgi:hypothetical protein
MGKRFAYTTMGSTQGLNKTACELDQLARAVLGSLYQPFLTAKVILLRDCS